MLKEFFRFSLNENSRMAMEAELEDETELNEPSPSAKALAKLAEEFDRAAAPAAPVRCEPLPSTKVPSFEQVYAQAAVKPPRLPYSILKVSDMLNSSHIAGLSADAKRCSVLMALEAASVELEDLLQDAMVRQRALNDFEEAQQNRLKDLETAKADENRKIQAELDRLTNQYMALIQGNVDEVAREQDHFRAWQKRKQQEAQRITDAASLCVPPGAPTNGNGMSAVLERASAFRK